MAWYNSIGDFTSSLQSGSLVNDLMSSIGIGNDTIADSPIGSFLGMAQNKEAKRQFDESMAWNKYMFNNAHQAEVADLEKAGLNPILSYGGSGATSGSPSPTAHMDNGSAGLGFITNLIQGISGIKNANSANTVAIATDKKATAESNLMDAQADAVRAEIPYKAQQSKQAQQLVESTISKSPRQAIPAVVKGVKDVISEGSHSNTATKYERYGERLGVNQTLSEQSKFWKKLNKMDRLSKGISKPYTNLIRGAISLYNAVSSTVD